MEKSQDKLDKYKRFLFLDDILKLHRAFGDGEPHSDQAEYDELGIELGFFVRDENGNILVVIG